MYFLHTIVEEDEAEAFAQKALPAPEPPEHPPQPSPPKSRNVANSKCKKTTLDYLEKKEKPRHGNFQSNTALVGMALDVQKKLKKVYDKPDKRQTSSKRSPRRSSSPTPKVSRRQDTSTPKTTRKRKSLTPRNARRQSASPRGSKSQETSTPKSSRRRSSLALGGSGSQGSPIASSSTLKGSRRRSSQSRESFIRKSSTALEDFNPSFLTMLNSKRNSFSTPERSADLLSPPTRLVLRSRSPQSLSARGKSKTTSLMGAGRKLQSSAVEHLFMNSAEEEEEVSKPQPRQPKKRQPKKRQPMGFPEENVAPKAKRHRRRQRQPVEDDLPAPQWVINLMFDIEDATKHELTVE